MKIKHIFLALAAVLILAAPSQARKPKVPAEVTLSKEVLKDKIKGAWAGQIIGCSYGGPTEFKYATTIDQKIDIPWPEHGIKRWYDRFPGLYDDVYMDLTFVEVFAKEGLDAPIESFAKAFANAPYPLWHANRQARYNILAGIMPPESGHWLNNPHADDIDFQIEADYAGIMAPGMVNAAAHYCDEIGHMMNYGDGWYGGVYVAAMYALAFVSNDIDFIVNEALKVIPEGTRYHTAMSDVIRWHKQYPDDWHICWALVNKEHAFDIGCPGGVYSAFNIDAVLNSAYILIGLLYGEKNYYRTLDISTRCGADSDCNPASAGGILGTVLGFEGIPEYWRKPIYEVLDRDLVYTDISVNKATDMSFDQALQVIRLNGGTVEDDKVILPCQKPVPVRFEQSFPGHWPQEKKDIKRYVDKAGELSWEGIGVVYSFSWQKPKDYQEHGYEAEVECYLDGKLDKTVRIPSGGNNLANELYFHYNLPKGKHTVSFKLLNPEEGVRLIIGSQLTYSDELILTRHEDK